VSPITTPNTTEYVIPGGSVVAPPVVVRRPRRAELRRTPTRRARTFRHRVDQSGERTNRLEITVTAPSHRFLRRPPLARSEKDCASVRDRRALLRQIIAPRVIRSRSPANVTISLRPGAGAFERFRRRLSRSRSASNALLHCSIPEYERASLRYLRRKSKARTTLSGLCSHSARDWRAQRFGSQQRARPPAGLQAHGAGSYEHEENLRCQFRRPPNSTA
jgi:hypothetical protein